MSSAQQSKTQLRRFPLLVGLRALAHSFSRRPVLLAVGCSPWKESFIRNFFVGNAVLFVDDEQSIRLARAILSEKAPTCVIWSFKDEELGLPQEVFAPFQVLRLEDGFIRSIGRGVDHTPPWSLCLDRLGMYFDASHPSEFEQLCNSLSKEEFERERQMVANLMQLMNEMAISKYNLSLSDGASRVQNLQSGAVLVLGQVEDDRSLTRNNNAIDNNADLIRRAVADFPDRPIYFKQHPDCVGIRRRPGYVDLRSLATVSEMPAFLAMTDALKAVEEVYTISSLGGFEALIQGKKVTTFGCPFYAGWGLTVDHVAFPRRQRQLSLEELFYVAYVRYPTYFNPHSGQRMTAEQVIRQFADQKRHAV